MHVYTCIYINRYVCVMGGEKRGQERREERRKKERRGEERGREERGGVCVPS